MKYSQMDREALLCEKSKLTAKYEDYKSKGLKLNMARGKPGAEQLAISMPMLDVLNSSSDCRADDGADCRNYGELSGISDAKKLFSEYME